MRSLAATIMSFGAIAVAFGTVTVGILLLAKWNSYPSLAGITRIGTLSLVAGAALLVLGYLMGRMGRRTNSGTAETIRS